MAENIQTSVPVAHDLCLNVYCITAGKVVCQGRSYTEEKVLLGCDDGSLALYDEYKKVTQMTHMKIVSSHLLLHSKIVTKLYETAV